ncbi:MAG: metallophosphoesterase family protein [Desulfobulbaceae bacterium]|nr:metallophosphoesterase family protein [Desulfobulbaceae bacterium]
MTAKIGLISDIHACATPLAEALAIFDRENVSFLLCAGDIAGYGSELGESVKLLKDSNCFSILGNHDAWYLDKTGEKEESPVVEYLAGLPRVWESVVQGVRVYAVHASPPASIDAGIRLLDEHGRIIESEKKRWEGRLGQYPFDILVVGHTHQVFAEQMGNRLIINPGSTKFNHTCAILSLPEREFRLIPLSGKKPVMSWHWGMMTGNGGTKQRDH